MFQSDDAKLALLSGLPIHVPTEALASLVSGNGKEAFSDLLSRVKDAFLMSNSPEVMDASAASLRFFLDASHAKGAEVWVSLWMSFIGGGWCCWCWCWFGSCAVW